VESLSVGQLFRNLRLIYYALLAGPVFFFAAALYVRTLGAAVLPEALHETLKYAAAGATVLAVFLGRLFRLFLLRSAIKEADLHRKVKTYFAASVMAWAFLEAAGFINSVGTLTGRPLYLGLFAVVMAVYAMSRPSVDRLVEELNLPAQDAHTIRTSLAGKSH
jgi:hypothetical protein